MRLVSPLSLSQNKMRGGKARMSFTYKQEGGGAGGARFCFAYNIRHCCVDAVLPLDVGIENV